MALVPLITGVERSAWERPIMGPPAMTFHTSPCRPPAASMAWAKGVPMGTIRFFGSLIPWPVIVTIRRRMGSPSATARHTLAQVAMLKTAHPTSLGNPPEGTWRPVTAWMSCFSAPWG